MIIKTLKLDLVPGSKEDEVQDGRRGELSRVNPLPPPHRTGREMKGKEQVEVL